MLTFVTFIINTSNFRNPGPVVHSIVSLTSSLTGQVIKSFTTYNEIHFFFLVEKMLEAFAKASHIFTTKNIGIFEQLTFENLTKRFLTMSLVLNNRILYVGSFKYDFI